MVWDTGVPMVVKGTFYTMYIPYPPNLAQPRKNGKTTLKIEKFVIHTPHQADPVISLVWGNWNFFSIDWFEIEIDFSKKWFFKFFKLIFKKNEIDFTKRNSWSCTPHQADPDPESGFWFRGCWLNLGVSQNLDPSPSQLFSLESTVKTSLLEKFQKSKSL